MRRLHKVCHGVILDPARKPAARNHKGDPEKRAAASFSLSRCYVYIIKKGFENLPNYTRPTKKQHIKHLQREDQNKSARTPAKDTAKQQKKQFCGGGRELSLGVAPS